MTVLSWGNSTDAQAPCQILEIGVKTGLFEYIIVPPKVFSELQLRVQMQGF